MNSARMGVARRVCIASLRGGHRWTFQTLRAFVLAVQKEIPSLNRLRCVCPQVFHVIADFKALDQPDLSLSRFSQLNCADINDSHCGCPGTTLSLPNPSRHWDAAILRRPVGSGDVNRRVELERSGMVIVDEWTSVPQTTYLFLQLQLKSSNIDLFPEVSIFTTAQK